MSALLEIKNIETYYDLIYAIRGASLTVEEGSITAILGNNGAGKSTILKTVMGLIEDQPDKGTIEFMGKRIDGLDTDKIVRMGITLVPEGREVFEELTIRENLLMGAYIRSDKKGIDDDFDRVFSYFPILKERVNQWAGTLSGGEQQMLAIGRALMSHPEILLLDEPSLGLAPLIIKTIFEMGLHLIFAFRHIPSLSLRPMISTSFRAANSPLYSSSTICRQNILPEVHCINSQ